MHVPSTLKVRCGLLVVPLVALIFGGCSNSDQATGPIQEPVAAKQANNAMIDFMTKQGKMPGTTPKK